MKLLNSNAHVVFACRYHFVKTLKIHIIYNIQIYFVVTGKLEFPRKCVCKSYDHLHALMHR